MHILIIDNDIKQRDQISEYLSDTRFNLSKVDDHDKALVLFEEKDIKIVIADFDNGDKTSQNLIDGIIERISDSPPFVIFLVNESSQQDALHTLGPIHGDYVVKPITSDSIYGRIVVAERSLMMRERLERVQRDNQTLALYDQLTGAFNRQAIYDHALAEISRAQREGLSLCIAMIEICNLQEIESDHGYDIRDQVLRYVSSAVRANVRIYDLLGRWIGAKFMLMLPNTSMLDASSVIDRVNQSVSSIDIQLDDKSRLNIIVKYGVSSVIPGESMPLYQLVEQANSALIEATNQVEKQVVLFES